MPGVTVFTKTYRADTDGRRALVSDLLAAATLGFDIDVTTLPANAQTGRRLSLLVSAADLEANTDTG